MKKLHKIGEKYIGITIPKYIVDTLKLEPKQKVDISFEPKQKTITIKIL